MELTPYSLKDWTNGVICEDAVSESQYPENALYEAVNFHFDRIGTATLRKGETLVGSQIGAGKDIVGLHEFVDNNGSNEKLITVLDSKVYYFSSGWVSKRDVTAGLKTRFTNFLNFVWMVNGTDSTAIWDGTASNLFVTTGNATSAPIGKFIDNYRSRVWITGNSTYPDRVYYSSIPTAVATPVVTWNTSVTTGDWIDISPQDGENITALKRSKSALLVFKNNHIYRIFSVDQSDPDPKINVGTYSQESVVETKAGYFFHHPTGIYLYQDGAYPSEISKPVKPFLDAIASDQYENVCGWCDGDNVYFSIGDVTVKGIAYANITLKYAISTKVWAVYSYPTRPLASSSYNDGSILWNVVGDDNGNVLKINYGITDNSTPIFYRLKTKPLTIDGSTATRKNITKMSVDSNGLRNSTLSVMEDGGIARPIKTIDSDISKSFTTDIKGNRINFILSGTSVGEPFVWNGVEILKGTSEII